MNFQNKFSEGIPREEEEMGLFTEKFTAELFSAKIDANNTNVNFSGINFTHIPDNKPPKNSAPKDVTLVNFDKSVIFHELFATEYHEIGDILGEMQFAFLSFFLGQSYEGFEQWKKIILLLCRCEKSTKENPEFFVNFINVLFWQIQEVPRDFFEDIVTCNNFLLASLKEFFEICSDTRMVQLSKSNKKLRNVVEKKFGINYSIEELENIDDEFSPTIVSREELLGFNLSEDQLQQILNKIED